MDRVELEAKLSAANEKVDKRKNTIQKLCGKLNVNYEQLLQAYQQFTNSMTNDYLLHRQAKEIVANFVQPKNSRDANGMYVSSAGDFNMLIDQLEDNLCKLFEVEAVAKNWEVKLNKETNREAVVQIPILVEFLDMWEDKAREYYHQLAEAQVQKMNEFHDITYNFLQEADYDNASYEQRKQIVKDFNRMIETRYYKSSRHPYGPYSIEDWIEGMDELGLVSIRFEKDPEYADKYYYSDFGYQGIPGKYVLYNFNEEKLNKLLKEERKRKYEALVNRVTEITGEITDVSGLDIDPRGDLNGIVIGKNGKARVNTIGAGGYNEGEIVNVKHGQVFHYRVLVKPVR